MPREALQSIDCRRLWGSLGLPGLLFHDPRSQEGWDRCGCFDPDRPGDDGCRELTPCERAPFPCRTLFIFWTEKAQVTTCCTCYQVILQAAGSPLAIAPMIDFALGDSTPAEAPSLPLQSPAPDPGRTVPVAEREPRGELSSAADLPESVWDAVTSLLEDDDSTHVRVIMAPTNLQPLQKPAADPESLGAA